MKLSTRARYALRAMIHIARGSKNGRPISLTDVADETSISRRYLEQVVIPLKNATLITGVSGKDGGYILAKPSEKIRIGEIVQAAIGPINIVNCANDPKKCERADLCECRPLYVILNRKIVEALNDFTLADLADPKRAKKIRRDVEALTEN